jgi:hypothetical protein
MAEITDHTTLISALESYGHRPDLTDEITDLFVPLALKRIGRKLRAQENEATETYTDQASPLTKPALFGSVRVLLHQAASGPRALVSMADQARWPLDRSGGPTEPYAYDVDSTGIVISPSQQSDYTLKYFAVPVVTAASPTDPALTAYPQLFLYAGLIELHRWDRDREARLDALDAFDAEIKDINRAAERARSDVSSGVAQPW